MDFARMQLHLETGYVMIGPSPGSRDLIECAGRMPAVVIGIGPGPKAGHVGVVDASQRRDHIEPRPVPSTLTRRAAFSSVSTNRIVLSDTPGTARRMSAIENVGAACSRT
jgi:hypothetical protein